MKVLIIQQKMIGDVLTSSILFEALRDQYPKAELHFVVNTHTYPVIENHPCIDKVHFFTPEIERSSLKLLTFARLLRKERYDAIIDVYSKLSSALITLISGAKIRVSKHKYYTSFVYTHTFKEKLSAKTNAGLAIENRLQLLEPLIGKRDPIKPKIYLTKEELEAAKSLLLNNKIALERPIFMIGVLGSGLNKTYPFMEMAKFIDSIVEEIPHAQILFNYIPKQKEEAQAIYDLCLPDSSRPIPRFHKGGMIFIKCTSFFVH